MQLPDPTPDQIWNWLKNVDGGIQRFKQIVADAKEYPQAVSESSRFKKLVDKFNEQRHQRGLQPLEITIPPFETGNFKKDDLRQLEKDAIRGYDGWHGKDKFGLEMHEFKIAVYAGILRVARINERALTGVAVWELVFASDRPQNAGNPNYVNEVLSASPDCGHGWQVTNPPRTDTVMPAPLRNTTDSIDVHVMPTPLFNGAATFTQLQQAPGIANCPVTAILAAFAFATSGAWVKGMVTAKPGEVSTDLSRVPPSRLSNPPQGRTLSSERSFSVKLGSGAIEVSDVLYTDDGSDWSPFYLRDPNNESIWGPIIEKALAVQFDGYENFDNQDTPANEFWARITGVSPGGIEIKPTTKLATIIDAARKSLSRPTIGASKPDSADVRVVKEFHGYAMLGMRGSKIKLYDAAAAKIIFISPVDFRHDFQAILWRK
jgi:hypothetical protein